MARRAKVGQAVPAQRQVAPGQESRGRQFVGRMPDLSCQQSVWAGRKEGIPLGQEVLECTRLSWSRLAR